MSVTLRRVTPESRCFWFCPDCGGQFRIHQEHTCDKSGPRLAMEIILDIEPDNAMCLLWLVRIYYRIAQSSGMGDAMLSMDANRAAFARQACNLGWEIKR